MLDAIHNSQETFFKDPFGAVECKSNIDLKIKINKKHKINTVAVNFITDCGKTREIEMKLDGEEKDFFIYSISIKMPKDVGLYWYNFKVNADEETYYYGNNFEMLGGEGDVFTSNPLSYQVTVYKENNTTSDWLKDGIIYQIFPDRFYNGLENNLSLKPKRDMVFRADWNETPKYIKDEAGRVDFFDYFGGNLSGIIKKLPYLEELGISIIYLNPVFEGSSNHKYDTADYKSIDVMFGDEELFIELCEKAKQKGIRIILDGVFSHTGSDSIYFNRYGKYDSLGAYQSKESEYFSWYEFEHYPYNYTSWWGVDALPNVDELDQGYLDYMINDKDSVVNKWSKLGISGWRLDVADELPSEFIKQFKKQLKKADSESILMGEVWENASNKKSYGKRREYLLGEELDSTMNYPFRKTLVDFCLGDIDSKRAVKEMMEIYEHYPRHHFYSLMNLVGSHDIPRIMTVLGDSPEENELSQEEREEFKLESENYKLALKRLKLLTLVQMTFPGVPSIYYGDEAGVEGYSDPINRRTYPWGNEDSELLGWFKTITAIRNNYDVFKTGKFKLLGLDRDVFGFIREIKGSKDVFDRKKKNNFALVLINRSDRNIEIDLKVDNKDRLYNIFNDKYVNITSDKLNIKLDSFGYALLIESK